MTLKTRNILLILRLKPAAGVGLLTHRATIKKIYFLGIFLVLILHLYMVEVLQTY